MASLRDLGLSEYEARVYRALLDSGPTTAKKLSVSSGVPMGRIYDVLNGIEAQHLVRSQTASRPKKYVAVEPQTALDRLLEARVQELEEKADQYEQIAETLQRELHAEPVSDDEFWTAALGVEESIDLLVERIDAATERVVAIAGIPASGLELSGVGDVVADHFEAALERGVRVQILASRDLAASAPERTAARYVEDLQAHERFEVRIGEDVDGSFTVVDDYEVCIEVLNPLDPGETFALINLKDASFAGDVTETFRPRWAEATPL